MAYVETHPKTGKRRGRYQVPGQKAHASTPWTTQRASVVLRIASDLEAKARKKGLAFVDPRKGDVLFGAYAATFMEKRQKRTGTMARRRWLLKTFLLPRWRDVPIAGIAWDDVTEWADSVHTHAEVTVRHAISLLSTILTSAVDKKLIEVNPLHKRKWAGRTHPGAKREKVWAYPAAAIGISERMPTEATALMVLIAQFTGMRYGEICALRRDNCLVDHVIRVNGVDHIFKVLRVDPDEGAWHEESRLEEDGAEHQITYLGPPKNQRSARDVFLPDFLVERIEKHLADSPHIYPFCTPRGSLWLRSNWSDLLRPAADGRPAVPPRTRKPTMWQRIAADVLADVKSGALAPGDELPTLVEQAKRYQAGRATVQKAVTWLAREGVVDTASRKRTIVAAEPVMAEPPVTVVPGVEEWEPLAPGWGLHGGRHWCKSAVADGDELGSLPAAFQCQQLGHTHRGIEGVYSHVLLPSVQRFTALMQREWERAQPSFHDSLPNDSHGWVSGRSPRLHVRRSPRSGRGRPLA